MKRQREAEREVNGEKEIEVNRGKIKIKNY